MFNIRFIQSQPKFPKTSDRINICIDFHKLSGIFSEHSQDTLGPYILDKESWAMVPLFSHIMNIGSAQWGQIIFKEYSYSPVFSQNI